VVLLVAVPPQKVDTRRHHPHTQHPTLSKDKDRVTEMSFAHVFAAFGLTEQATALKRIFYLTDAYIGGSIALSCHTGDEITPYQDLDIVYTPSADAPVDITLMLFDIVFAAAGYERRDNSCGGYQRAKALHIVFVANWFHRDLRRLIQVVVRSADAKTPAYAEADFDICQFYLKYAPANGDLVLLYNPTNSAVTPAIAEEIRTRRVMRIGNLKGQNRVNSLLRLHKYYNRGFAFEKERETPCSCACGHEHTVKKIVRLTYYEAAAIVRAEHARANPRLGVPSVAAPIVQPVTAPIVQPVERPPPLEIPPILEITDALETPPRVKRTLPPRKCRKDDSWIRSDKE
jgi:hypothetical protein